jgi:diketogulonate reductase-like aldo/keto reductase
MAITAGVGMGTMEWVDGSREPAQMYDATLTYLKAGGRSIDCAEMYDTQAHVGRAIADSGVPRAEIFVTTKLSGLPINHGNSTASVDAVRERLAQHLKDLGIAYVDLLVMHWPGPSGSRSHAIDLLSNPEALAAACTWAYFDQHVDMAWENMRTLRDEGLCTRIGVSNFNEAHLERLARGASGELPFANQIYIDVTHQQRTLVSRMREQGILPIAYRALAFLPAVAMAADMGDGTQAALTALQASLKAASVQQVTVACRDSAVTAYQAKVSRFACIGRDRWCSPGSCAAASTCSPSRPTRRAQSRI